MSNPPKLLDRVRAAQPAYRGRICDVGPAVHSFPWQETPLGDAVEEPSRLIVKLLYGSGLRLLEALTLRVKDVDFARGQVTVRDPKWKHDRVTMLPASVSAEPSEQLVRAAALPRKTWCRVKLVSAGALRRRRTGCDRPEVPRCVPPLALAVGFPAPTRWKYETTEAGITTTRRTCSAP